VELGLGKAEVAEVGLEKGHYIEKLHTDKDIESAVWLGSAAGEDKQTDSSGAVEVDTGQEGIRAQLVDRDSLQPMDGIDGSLAMAQVVLRSQVKKEYPPAELFCELQPLTSLLIFSLHL